MLQVSGVLEYQADQFPEAVEAGFEADLVVVRGLIDPGAWQALKSKYNIRPSENKTLDLLASRAIGQLVPGHKEAKHVTRRWIRHNLGMPTLLATYGQVQVADRYRNGSIQAHKDRQPIITATSINVENGDEPTIYLAERLEDSTARHADIFKAFISWGPEPIPKYKVELKPGDAVISSRGVAHGVQAPDERGAVIMGTKSLLTK